MADTNIGKAVLQIAVDDRQYKQALGQVSRETEGLGQRLKSISAGVNFLVFKEIATIGVKAIKSITTELVALGVKGAAIADVAGAFDALSQRAGETSAAMLGPLRAGVKGTLSDFDLMTLANKALGAGLAKSSDDMGVLASGARALGKAAGIDTTQAFETLTTAIASGRTAQLKQLGLFVDSKVATEEFARAHGKTVSQLTDADRAQALAAATMDALRERMQLIKPDAADFGELIEAAKVSFQNFTDGLAVGIAQSPVLSQGMTALGAALGTAFGPDKGTLIEMIVQGLERMAIFGVEMAKVLVTGATMIFQAYEMVKVGLNAALQVLFTGLGAINGALATLLEKASMLPGIGEQFKGAAQGLREASDLAKSLAFGFGQVSKESLASAQNAEITAIRINAALEQARQAMIQAQANATVQKDVQAATTEQMYARETAAAAAHVAAVQTGETALAASVMATRNLSAASAVASNLKVLASTKSTAAAELAAIQAAEKGKQDEEEKTAEHRKLSNEEILSSTTQALTSMFGQSKAAAIAATIANTAAAIVKTFAQLGFPWGIPPAAAMAARGAQEVGRIKSTNFSKGFAGGTENLDFMNFGKMMPTALHGQEAVVPRGKGHLLAGEIADAMPGGDPASLERLDRIASSLDNLPHVMTRAWKTAMATA